jgi:hypothetical protein
MRLTACAVRAAQSPVFSSPPHRWHGFLAHPHRASRFVSSVYFVVSFLRSGLSARAHCPPPFMTILRSVCAWAGPAVCRAGSCGCAGRSDPLSFCRLICQFVYLV